MSKVLQQIKQLQTMSFRKPAFVVLTVPVDVGKAALDRITHEIHQALFPFLPNGSDIIIIPDSMKLTALSDQELADLGLQRIPDGDDEADSDAA